MSFVPGTFIAPYSPTDTVIGIRTSSLDSVVNINVGNIQKILGEGNIVWIVNKDQTRITIPFNNETDAKSAITILNATLEQLLPNVRSKFGPIAIQAVPMTIIPITLANYIIAAGSNSLIQLQYYSVVDSGNVFGFGPGTIYIVQALATNDLSPAGRIASTGEKIILDFSSNKIVSYIHEGNKIFATNDSRVTASTSTYLNASDKSLITASGSQNIEARNFSILDVTNCNKVVVDNFCNLTLANCTNCTFNNITGNLSAFIFSNITVDKNQSKGLETQAVLNATNNEVLNAYIVSNRLSIPILAANLIKKLDNPITDANATFIIKAESSQLGIYSLTIQDKNGATLAIITSAYDGLEVSFSFNKVTGLFELNPIGVKEKVLLLTVGINGQTLFSSVLVPTPIYPTLAKLAVNGVDQVYGVGKDFTITGDSLTWVSTSYNLETTDVVKVTYI